MTASASPEGDPRRARLMTPGPTELTPGIIEALARPAPAHYGEDWLQEHDEVMALLRRVFVTESEPVLLVGAGTAGIEAAAGTMLGENARVVVGVNGHFGERLAAVLGMLGLDVLRAEGPQHRGLTTDDLAPALKQGRPAELVAVVHCETATGVLNPVRELAQTAHEHGALVLVDAISSFGGVHLPVDEWGIDVCVGAPQKCLGAVPGVCPMAVAEAAWRRMEETARHKNAGGWSLNLLRYRYYMSQRAVWEPYHVTMPCPVVRALAAALRGLVREGSATHYRRIARLAAGFRAGVRVLGCGTVADEEWASPTVTATILPDGISGLKARDFLRSRTGYLVGYGAGECRDRGFRIGHFGATANEGCTDELLLGLGRFLGSEGCEPDETAAVEAARAIWEADETLRAPAV